MTADGKRSEAGEQSRGEHGRADSKRVVVVGGGISGLTAAYRLLTAPRNGRPPDVTVMEAVPRLGGKLRTTNLEGLQVEEGADSFVVRKPGAVGLCRELGLGEDLVVPGASGAYVWTGGRLVPFPRRSAFGIPADIGELLRWPGLSRAGRLRALMDLLIPPRKDEVDESLRSLVGRRMGRDVAEILVAPLLAGIHAADSSRLSVAATFPELRAWERGHGSLLRGARASVKGARGSRGPLFATLWSGLSRLVDALEVAIGPARIRRETRVAAIGGVTPPYEVRADGECITADAVVLATPAFESARLLAGLAPLASAELGGIQYASTAVATLVYARGTASLLPDATGFVVPMGNGVMTACTWVSRKWPRDDYDERAVVRCFVGRAGEEGRLDMTDDELVDALSRELGDATALTGDPSAAAVHRWDDAMPQYDVGHLGRVERIEDALKARRGVFLTGSAYRGVGIADCISNATEVARRVLAYLHGTPAADATPPFEREAI